MNRRNLHHQLLIVLPPLQFVTSGSTPTSKCSGIAVISSRKRALLSPEQLGLPPIAPRPCPPQSSVISAYSKLNLLIKTAKHPSKRTVSNSKHPLPKLVPSATRYIPILAWHNWRGPVNVSQMYGKPVK